MTWSDHHRKPCRDGGMGKCKFKNLKKRTERLQYLQYCSDVTLSSAQYSKFKIHFDPQ